MEKVWTRRYRPFIMGGDVNRAIATMVEPIEKKEHMGVTLFSFLTPKGLRVAESQTGGIVGDSFDNVINDMNAATREIIADQLKNVKNQSDAAEMVSIDVFFDYYCR